jgi:hypothetical protein
MRDEPMRSLRVRAGLAARILVDPRALHVPPGHPYSPIASPEDVARALARAADAPRTLPGIDLDEAGQLDLIERLARFYPDLPFADERGPHRYGYANSWFTYGDAICYATLLRHLRPRRVIEVGAGHSSALALDVDFAARTLTGTATLQLDRRDREIGRAHV